MKIKSQFQKLLVFTLVVQLCFSPAFAQNQQAAPAQQPKTYQPYIVVDGIYLPDEQVSHLPKYRSNYLHAFNEQGQVQLVDYNQVAQWKKKYVADTSAPVVPENYLAKGRDQLAMGKDAYQQLDFTRALKNLTAARNEFILNLSHLRSNRDLLEAHLYLGMTYIALAQNNKVASQKEENEKLAQVEFEKVVMLDPQRELSSANFSPEVVRMYERVRQRLTANNRITVRIDANVTQAKVYINGKLLGPTPIKTRLIPGDYYMLLERKGMKPWSQLMSLRNTVENVQANLQAATENTQWNDLFQIREGNDQHTMSMEDLNNMARAVGGELILLSNVEQLENRLRLLGQLYDVRTQEFSQVAIVDIGDAPLDPMQPLADFEPASYDMAKALASMVRPDGYLINSGQSLMGVDPMRVTPEQSKGIERHDAPKAKLYQKWWFWAGVAAIGVGGFFAIRELGGTSGSSTLVIDNNGNF